VVTDKVPVAAAAPPLGVSAAPAPTTITLASARLTLLRRNADI
jgi:hypothetical protein